MTIRKMERADHNKNRSENKGGNKNAGRGNRAKALCRIGAAGLAMLLCLGGMPMQAEARLINAGQNLSNYARSRARAEARDYANSQRNNAMKGKQVKSVSGHLREKFGSTQLTSTYTQSHITGHSSLDFIYRSAKGIDYGSKLTGGKNYGAGTVAEILESENVRYVLSDPRSSNILGLGGADMAMDAQNEALTNYMYFLMTGTRDKSYQNMSAGDKLFTHMYQIQRAVHTSLEGLGKGTKRAYENIVYEQDRVNPKTGHTDFLDLMIKFFSGPNSKQGSMENTAASGASGALKPNIYLYGEAGLELNVAFGEKSLLTAADPDYPMDGWNVVLAGNGRLLPVSGGVGRENTAAEENSAGAVDGIIGADASGNEEYYMSGIHGLGGDAVSEDGTLGYLFYESLADGNLFQYDEAWRIGQESREDALYELMREYGFNDAEASDFATYWDAFLKEDTDYLFYPQLTDIIDAQMPLSVTPEPEHRFRMWFAVEEYDGTEYFRMPVITETASHEGLALTEWGIAFRLQQELSECPGAAVR